MKKNILIALLVAVIIVLGIVIWKKNVPITQNIQNNTASNTVASQYPNTFSISKEELNKYTNGTNSGFSINYQNGVTFNINRNACSASASECMGDAYYISSDFSRSGKIVDSIYIDQTGQFNATTMLGKYLGDEIYGNYTFKKYEPPYATNPKYKDSKIVYVLELSGEVFEIYHESSEPFAVDLSTLKN